jgi:DNA-binding phage protein
MARKPNAYERYLAEQLADPEFRAEFERERREIETIDAIVNALDGLRDERGLTKADLARQIGKNPASVRRLLTASGNPELRTVVAMANALDADIKIVRRSTGRARRTAA